MSLHYCIYLEHPNHKHIELLPLKAYMLHRSLVFQVVHESGLSRYNIKVSLLSVQPGFKWFAPDNRAIFDYSSVSCRIPLTGHHFQLVLVCKKEMLVNEFQKLAIDAGSKK